MLASFKLARWPDPASIGSFVSSVGGLQTPDIIKLLGVLGERGLAADVKAHQMRCVAFEQIAGGVADKALFGQYVRAIENASPPVQDVLVKLIPGVNDVTSHPRLCELLKSQNPEVRKTASRALSTVGRKSVADLLGKWLGDPKFIGRREAIDTIVRLPGGLEGLAGVFAVGDPAEKRHCIKYLADPALGQKNPRGVMEALRPALEDPNDEVAGQACAAFAALCDEAHYFEDVAPFLDADRPRIAATAIRGLARYPSPRSISALERKLREGPHSLRLVAIETMEAIGTDEILSPLVDALSHQNLAVRNNATEALHRLSQAGKLTLHRTIIFLLRSRDVSLRRIAADLASSAKDPAGELWPKLIEYLRDEDWWVRERVMDALLEIAGKELSPFIAAFLQDPSDVVRRFACEVFARLKDPNTLGTLVGVARDDADWWVRERAVEAIAAIGDQRAVPHILDIMQKDVDIQVCCLKALTEMKAKEAAPKIAMLAAEAEVDVRLMIIAALSAFDATEHTEVIESLASDADPRVSAAAQDLLTQWNVALQSGIQESLSNLSTLDTFLLACARHEGDDLILAPGRRPYVKKLGKVIPLGKRTFSAKEVQGTISQHLSAVQIEALTQLREVDFSYEVPGRGDRFRANVFQQRGGLAAVFRIIKGDLISLRKLGLPEIVQSFGDYPNGLVVVGGPTGSGKSTTLAALIDQISASSGRHIVSIEDPIEIVHKKRQKGLVNQRELGSHTEAGGTALRATLRQDPDVILVGEMRDFETISFAVTAAETGHLVFGTVHTVSVDSTVDRMVNAFPVGQRAQVRTMLADSLRAVLCQLLLPKKGGVGRVLVAEVMLNSDAVSNLIRKGKSHQIPSVITTSRELGMQSMDSQLKRVFEQGLISAEEAYMRAASKKDFEELFEKERELAQARATVKRG